MRNLLMAAVALAALCAGPCFGAVVYVDVDAAGAHDGLSWATAYNSLVTALSVSAGGDEVWVAEGTYVPAAAGGSRSASFVIPNGVALYGGFAGTETARMERNPAAHITVLSGDINGDGEGNAYRVVRVVDADSAANVLDGFTISDGNAVTYPRTTGGGLYVENAQLAVVQCVFRGNSATNNGGGAYVKAGTVSFVDCTFTGNTAYGFGAALAAYPNDEQSTRSVVSVSGCTFDANLVNYAVCAAYTDLTLARDTFVENEAGALCLPDRATLAAENSVMTHNGGLQGAFHLGTRSTAALAYCTLAGDATTEIYVVSDVSEPTALSVSNSIVWNDTELAIGLDSSEGTNVTVSHTIIAGGYDGEGNMDVEPSFRLPSPPCQLNWDSPAIDAASGSAPAADILGQARPQNQAADLGAYEFGTDSDGGGLPDAFETAYGLAVQDPADDTLDSDNDGLDNREEFRRGTIPSDMNDPAKDYYVSPTGSDGDGAGTEAAPWQTIAHAMDSVPEALDTFQVTIHLAAGVFNESEPVVLRSHTSLVGAGAGETTIEYYQAPDDEHVVITGAEGSELRACTVTFPSPVTATAELLRIDNVAMTVHNVVFNGADSPHAIAVFITQPGSSGSIIRNSTIKRVEYGVFAVDSGVNVTRNTFEDIFEGAIFIRPPEGKASGETPMLGDTASAGNTGFNRFNMSTGFFIQNQAENEVYAQYNDWGVYTGEAIGAQIDAGTGKVQAGAVSYAPFIGQSLVNAALVVGIQGEDTGQSILDGYHPKAAVGAIAPARDGSSQFFIFTSLSGGGQLVEASATHYTSQSRTVTVVPGDISVELFTLVRVAGEGEGEGEDGGCFHAAGTLAGPPSPGSGGDRFVLLTVLSLLAGVALRMRHRVRPSHAPHSF